MKRLLLLLSLLACVSSPLIAGKKQRGPSTDEERAAFLQIADNFRREPLNSAAKDRNGAALAWLIEVPDVHVTVCMVPLTDEKYRYNSEMFSGQMLSAGAFAIRFPELNTDLELNMAAQLDGQAATYRSILAADPDKGHDAHMDEFLANIDSGHLPENARSAVEKCNIKDKSTPQVNPSVQQLVGYGTKLHDARLYELAVIEFQRALAKDSNDWATHYELGNTLYALKRSTAAREHIGRALQLSPKCLNCQIALGNMLDDEGKPEEALAYYHRAAEYSNNSSASMNEGITLMRLKRWDEAEVALRKSITQDGSYATPHFNLAKLLAAKERIYDAVDELQAFVKLTTTADPRRSDVERALKPNVHIDSSKTTGTEAINAFVEYGKTRAAWIAEKYREAHPGAFAYQRTIDEEVASLTNEAAAWEKGRGAKHDPQLDRLLEIRKADFLEPFAAMTMASSNTEAKLWAEQNAQKLAALKQWATQKNVSLAEVEQPVTVEWMFSSLH